ncbi:MAG: hypothetical protein HRU27_08710 [Rhizobiaceae bacterium]|nr:hypothetical protein [Hyphomicrobiales bacterium]NRB30663.1 hypothetical protein [Rhizobiaceae bacterium]
MHDPETEFEGQEENDEFTIEDFYRFREASSRFHEGATELMAAMVRVQMLMLDDAKMTLSEVADGFSGAIRKQRMSDEPFS